MAKDTTDAHLAQVAQLEAQLTAAKENERRALADYQNVLRRQQEERLRTIKLATEDFVRALVQPLDHLHLAAQQLNDKGLHMVMGQFWHTLREYGLEEFGKVGDEFNPLTMEAVESIGEGQVVQKIMQPGYTLNGEVIKVAKVIVG
jgi:molecular chaperone GrpE